MLVAIMQGFSIIGIVEEGSRDALDLLAAHKGSKSVTPLTGQQSMDSRAPVGRIRPPMEQLLATEAVRRLR